MHPLATAVVTRVCWKVPALTEVTSEFFSDEKACDEEVKPRAAVEAMVTE